MSKVRACSKKDFAPVISDGNLTTSVIVYTLSVEAVPRIFVPVTRLVHTSYVIGRADSSSTFMPDIDLASFKARSKGVSRRHAAFVLYHDELHLLDLGSVNGTFLNDMPLAPDTPHRLDRHNTIRLGMLLLQIE